MAEQHPDEQPSGESRRGFGPRDLLRSVNLRDFSEMVGGELQLISNSLRVAAEALPRLPFGPVFFFVGMLLAALRSCLLLLVVVFFGSAILVITIIRGVTRLFRGVTRLFGGSREEENEEGEDV